MATERSQLHRLDIGWCGECRQDMHKQVQGLAKVRAIDQADMCSHHCWQPVNYCVQECRFLAVQI